MNAKQHDFYHQKNSLYIFFLVCLYGRKEKVGLAGWGREGICNPSRGNIGEERLRSAAGCLLLYPEAWRGSWEGEAEARGGTFQKDSVGG